VAVALWIVATSRATNMDNKEVFKNPLPVWGIIGCAFLSGVKFPRRGGQEAENMRKKSRHVHDNETESESLRP
jgi:hypothetical protein